MSDSLKKPSHSLIRSFIMSDLSKSLMVALLSWATWAIRSQLLFDMSHLSDLLTVTHLSWATWANRSQSLIWSEQMSELALSRWANSQPCSFVMSDLSDSLTSLFKREGMSESLIFLNLQKTFKKRTKNTIFSKFVEWITRFLWVKGQMSNSPQKQAICSRLLFCHERPEWFTHGHSIIMSDLSDLLTVAHLSWAIWMNPSQAL